MECLMQQIMIAMLSTTPVQQAQLVDHLENNRAKPPVIRQIDGKKAHLPAGPLKKS